MRNELARIYREASPATKIIYDLAQDNATGQSENWIIRWLLWHVFRYRDERNGSRHKKSTNLIQEDRDAAESSVAAESAMLGDDSSSMVHAPLQHEQTASPTIATYSERSEGGLRSSSTAIPDSIYSAKVSPTPEPSRTRFWDPVREVWRETERTPSIWHPDVDQAASEDNNPSPSSESKI